MIPTKGSAKARSKVPTLFWTSIPTGTFLVVVGVVFVCRPVHRFSKRDSLTEIVNLQLSK